MQKRIRHIAILLLLIYQINVSHMVFSESAHLIVHFWEELVEHDHYHHHHHNHHSTHHSPKNDHKHNLLFSFEESFSGKNPFCEDRQNNTQIVRIPFDKHFSVPEYVYNKDNKGPFDFNFFSESEVIAPFIDILLPPPQEQHL